MGGYILDDLPNSGDWIIGKLDAIMHLDAYYYPGSRSLAQDAEWNRLETQLKRLRRSGLPCVRVGSSYAYEVNTVAGWMDQYKQKRWNKNSGVKYECGSGTP